jgi:hypothetical protein
MPKYKAKVPLYRGKIKPGDELPGDWVANVSWVEQGLVELVKTESKKPVPKKGGENKKGVDNE